MADSLNNINPIDLYDPKDSLIMKQETETPLTANIYEIARFIDSLKFKYIDIPEDTLTMGIYGYMSEIGINILENTAVMSAEYSNEAIPTQAKFEKNIICHALSLGINKIRATPSEMVVYIGIPEDKLISNLSYHEIHGEKVFILDKEFVINIGKETANYSYKLDYDILIKQNELSTGEFTYTATYLLDNDNEISTIRNPYLPTVGVVKISNTNMLLLTVTIKQIQHYEIYKKILVTNPLETKSMTFTFSDQLAFFYVDVVENGVLHHLQCLYDGLYNTDTGKEYCNYSYINANTIRIVFNRDSYQPRQNAEVTIHYYTTKGSECNFDYNATTIQDLYSSRFDYNDIYMMIMPLSNSDYGTDRKNIDELKAIIPKQMLMRNSISTYTDLNNYFNSLNNDRIRLYFLQKVHNQIERLFFGYILIKDENNHIMPTNTVDIDLTREVFGNINSQNYIIEPGTPFLISNKNENAKGVNDIPSFVTNPTDDIDIDQKKQWMLEKENNGFLYMNPFLIAVNKNPFMVNYYMTILDYAKTVNFEYINTKSELQFIVTSSGTNPVSVSKPLFQGNSIDNSLYTISVTLIQNITADYGMIVLDSQDPTQIIKNNMRVLGIIYVNGTPVRWCEASITGADYDDTEFIYTYKFYLTTNNVIDSNNKINITSGLKNVGSNTEYQTTLPHNVQFKLFILGKFDEEYGTGKTENDDIKKLVPDLDGYTLCNVYELDSGLDMFIDYTNIAESYVELSEDDDTGDMVFHIRRVPLVRYSYLENNTRVNNFLRILDYRRLYIQTALIILEDSFGVDFKFFNTYGPSKMYNVRSNKENSVPLDRVNISLRFEMQLQTASDVYIKDDIINYIKEYMENINYLTDLHLPNLTTAVKNKFYKQLVYFKFVELNDYVKKPPVSNEGYLYQSIYKNTDDDDYLFSYTVPEFICVNIVKNEEGLDSPDITIDIID